MTDLERVQAEIDQTNAVVDSVLVPAVQALASVATGGGSGPVATLAATGFAELRDKLGALANAITVAPPSEEPPA